MSRLSNLLAWTVANVGGPHRSWRPCVFDRRASVLHIRYAHERLRLSLYFFRDSPESLRCENNVDHHWQLWRACLSTRWEFARAVYPPPVTAVLVPLVTLSHIKFFCKIPPSANYMLLRYRIISLNYNVQK